MKQLIICVETSKTANTDVSYIDKTIKFYYDTSNIKLTYIFCEGKSKYNSKSVLSKIKDARRKVKDSFVIYAFDTDSIDSNSNDLELTKAIESFCINNKFYYVWFSRNIEEVYLHKSIAKTNKVAQAKLFSNRNDLGYAGKKSLSYNEVTRYKSNILNVLRILLSEKR